MDTFRQHSHLLAQGAPLLLRFNYCNRVLVILIVHNVWRTALTPCSCSSSVFTVHLLLAIGTKRRLMLWPGGINSISSDTKSRLGSGRVSHLIHTWFLLSCSVVAADIAEKAHLGHVAHSVLFMIRMNGIRYNWLFIEWRGGEIWIKEFPLTWTGSPIKGEKVQEATFGVV